MTDPLLISSPPEVGVPPRLDIEATLREMHLTMQMLQEQNGTSSPVSSAESVEDDEFITSIAKEVSRKNMWGKILMYFAGIIGTIFSIGMAYSLMIGENATDTEVTDAINQMVIEHNGGVDPNEKAKNGAPLGHHPDMKEDLKKVKEDTENIRTEVKDIGTSQKRSEKREKYQFLMSRYQTELIECQRKRNCKPSKKPPELTTIETELLLGNYD